VSRKIHCIDCSCMSEKELCDVLKIPYIPWYKSAFNWGIILISISQILLLLELVL